jgi:hypothetical protein
MTPMERKSSMSTELTSMADMNISRFITNNCTRSRNLQQSVEARVTKTIVLERCGGGSSSKGIVCGRLRTCGRKTEGVHRPGAITHGDHVPGSKILHI